MVKMVLCSKYAYRGAVNGVRGDKGGVVEVRDDRVHRELRDQLVLELEVGLLEPRVVDGPCRVREQDEQVRSRAHQAPHEQLVDGAGLAVWVGETAVPQTAAAGVGEQRSAVRHQRHPEDGHRGEEGSGALGEQTDVPPHDHGGGRERGER